jgi:hypothetical protein
VLKLQPDTTTRNDLFPNHPELANFEQMVLIDPRLHLTLSAFGLTGLSIPAKLARHCAGRKRRKFRNGLSSVLQH